MPSLNPDLSASVAKAVEALREIERGGVKAADAERWVRAAEDLEQVRQQARDQLWPPPKPVSQKAITSQPIT